MTVHPSAASASQSLFQRLLGQRFDALPAPVQRLHSARSVTLAVGRARVARGAGALSRFFAAVSGLPEPGNDVGVRVEIDARRGCETWTRTFAGKPMRSMLRERGGLLHESLGAAGFWFRLEASAEGIDWHLVRVAVLGVPLPVAWFRDIVARERAEGNRYSFDVRAALPGVGLLVHYRGWLDVPA
jgi:hypothetical protein